MKSAAFGIAIIVTLAIFSAPGIVHSQPSPQSLPVAGYEAARDLPGAHELPDPNMDYKVVFSVGQDSKNPAEVHPMLPTIALYVNTLAKYGVPASHRHIVVMFHQRSADFDIVMSNEAYKVRYEGKDNPNVALIHTLKQAGVDFRLCGQGLIGRKIDAKDVNPDIQIDLWAMTTMVNLQMKGYARVG
jgi:intracellular sulfur oxidation DsrE/DsrF family protein